VEIIEEDENDKFEHKSQKKILINEKEINNNTSNNNNINNN